MLVDVHRNVNVRQKPASGRLPRWVEMGENQAVLDLVVSLLRLLSEHVLAFFR